jgi:hypothetical protein
VEPQHIEGYFEGLKPADVEALLDRVEKETVIAVNFFFS